MFILGIDVGGSSTAIGILSENGEIIDQIVYKTQACPIDDFYTSSCKYIDLIISTHKDLSVSLIGLSIRGIVDCEKKLLLSSSIIHMIPGFDLCAKLQAKYGIPVYIENDVKASTLAEMQYGTARHYKNFGYINVGTGLGLGVVCNGQLVHGNSFSAGEICNAPFIDSEGVTKGLEEIVSGTGFVNTAREKYIGGACPKTQMHLMNKNFSAKDVFDAYEMDDPLAKQTINQAIHCLFMELIHIECILNLEHYLFMGSVSNNPVFLRRLEEEKRNNQSLNIDIGNISFQLTGLCSKEIGLLGASSTAQYYFKREETS